MNRITISQDIDGVYYNWGDTVRYLIKQEWGIDLPVSTHWHFVQENVPEHVWKWLWENGKDLGMFKYGNIYKGAVEGLTALSERYRIEIVTHRPDWAIPDTCIFIATRMPHVYSGIKLLTEGEPKSEVNCDIYLDDNPAVIQEVLEAGKQAVVFDQPWNQHIETNRPYWRAYGWDDVPSVIEDAADFLLDQERESLTYA